MLNRCCDHARDAFDIAHYVTIPKAQDPIAVNPEIFVAPLVPFDLFALCMLAAVNLDNQFSFM